MKNMQATIVCPVCGAERKRSHAWLRKVKHQPTYSRHCSGILRGQEWAKHGHKGRAAWSKESSAAFPEKVSREKSGRWKGGRRVRTDGYIEVLRPEHRRAKSNGYVLEHVVVMESIVGRPLLPGEVVHHRDENRANNAPENLQLFASNGEHRRIAHSASAVVSR